MDNMSDTWQAGYLFVVVCCAQMIMKLINYIRYLYLKELKLEGS